MAKTRLSERIFTLSLAILFGFTAVATTVAVIVSVVSANNAQKKADAAAAKNKTSQSTTNKCTTSCLAGKPLSGFTPTNNVSSLQITDTKVGTGAVAKSTSTVSVIYTGAVASTGIVFQSSLDNGPQPVSIPLTGVIPGWQKGITGMKVGGTRRLLIPAAEAYGANPPQGSGIPPNSNLVFDVTLLQVK